MATKTGPRPKRVPTKRSPAEYGVAKARLGQPVTTIKRAPLETQDAYERAKSLVMRPVGPTETAAPATEGGGGGGFFDKRITWGGSQLQAPKTAPTFGGSTASPRFNKGTSARLIILAMGVAGGAILISGRNIKPYDSGVKDSQGKPITVPGNLHSFAGVVIAGTIALIVNEVSADLGMLFAVSMGFIALADVKAYTAIGNAIFGGGGTGSPGKQYIGGGTSLPQGKGSQSPVQPGGGYRYGPGQAPVYPNP